MTGCIFAPCLRVGDFDVCADCYGTVQTLWNLYPEAKLQTALRFLAERDQVLDSPVQPQGLFPKQRRLSLVP